MYLRYPSYTFSDAPMPTGAYHHATSWLPGTQITGPAHALIDDRAFWRHQQQGLTVYAAPNFFRSYWAPRPLREIAKVSNHFHVTQLFPSLADSTRFYVLALSQKDVRLIEATRSSVAKTSTSGSSTMS